MEILGNKTFQKFHKNVYNIFINKSMRPEKLKTSYDLDFRDRPSHPWLNSPLLKGYSPGFTVGSCDAKRLGDWADDEESVLGLEIAERGKCGLCSPMSNEKRNKSHKTPQKVTKYKHSAISKQNCDVSVVLATSKWIFALLKSWGFWDWRTECRSGTQISFRCSRSLRAAFGYSCEGKMRQSLSSRSWLLGFQLFCSKCTCTSEDTT